MSLFEPDRSSERTPVSVITGFLGSGKTTMLNHLLRQPELADSAVIINEFGEVGLDHLLIEAIDGEVAVLSSGCVCCTLRSDLEATLRDLLARRDRGEVPPFRRVIVETTGLADPAPIVQTLLNNPLISRFVRLDSIVATVDAVNGGAQLDAHPEAVKQAAIADRIFITKTDLADAEALASLEDRLAALNPGASREAVAHGIVESERLFGAALFDPERKSVDARRWLNEEAYHHHRHTHHRHDSGIAAFSVAADAPLD
ncbi:CobW family GTP-binding protein [Salinarimonas soli]|uniref:CobW family GTP-binding protein n=1 Tax=Salinarimonas soli TaxID=1638099 RepID=UPI001F0AB71D|nr:GTP-binding protein [Salinarimonas soli]